MNVDRETRHIDGVTLVSLRVGNPHDEPLRFRIENRLEGPVWPPRRGGRPDEGWDENGYEGVLGPGRGRGLGYATPGPDSNPPAVLAWVEPADQAWNREEARSVFARFGDPRPPRGVLTPDSQLTSQGRPEPSERGPVDPGGRP